MRSNPEPRDFGAFQNAEGSITETYSHGIYAFFTYFLELQTGGVLDSDGIICKPSGLVYARIQATRHTTRGSAVSCAISPYGFVQRASLATPMFLDRFPSKGLQHLRPFTELALPRILVVQRFQDLSGNRVLVFLRQRFHSLEGLFHQTRHTLRVARFRPRPLYS